MNDIKPELPKTRLYTLTGLLLVVFALIGVAATVVKLFEAIAPAQVSQAIWSQPPKNNNLPVMSVEQKEQARLWLMDFFRARKEEEDDALIKDTGKLELHLQNLESLNNRAKSLFGEHVDTNQYAICSYAVGSALNYWQKVGVIMMLHESYMGDGVADISGSIAQVIKWSLISGEHMGSCFNVLQNNKIIEMPTSP